MSDTAPHDSSPLSWRDVYKAVGDSEARVIAAIESAVAPLNISATNHETRIRELETHGSPEAITALSRLTVIEAAVAPLALLASDRDSRLTAVELQSNTTARTVDRFTDRGALVASTFSAGQKMVMVIAGIVGATAAVLTVLHALP